MMPMSPNQTFLDVHEIHEVTVLVATSSPDSASSSVDNSLPTSLTPESSLHARSSPTPSNPTVKFAPLPEINSNRKRSLAPLGVPARSRRIPIVQQESGSLLWSRDLDVPEDMEDPIVAFARFIKKTGKTLWRRVRKGSLKEAPREDVSYSSEPVLDIRSIDHPDDMILVERVDGENKRSRPVSWSPLTECRTLGKGDEAKRRSTSDLSHLS